ncbi:multiple epidermal growth factor-like domains protein 9 isoform X2 [Limulus polyphemus]|uniref:Multiple epidermal growth factor-like domains protein 9 isoform X2 n=1 Tax=Limulus polyphemus TaxID=6850 RepID=A0ABM1SW91_LIMPO|nr:multiple epidermal growth factor-like domains protein 9 isoform X2 [Limulus polyphemus]
MQSKTSYLYFTGELVIERTVLNLVIVWSLVQAASANGKVGLTEFQGKARDLLLPPTAKSKTLSGLDEGTKYDLLVSAVYSGNQRVPAPKKTVRTKDSHMNDLAVDEGYRYEMTPKEPECNCSEPGMVACTRMHGTVKCTCFPGYAGRWCESCSPGNYRDGKECKPCPCTNITSSGDCSLDKSGKVTCTSCLPGHRDVLCDSCTAGYHWKEDHCVALNCLSFSLCAEQRDDPSCIDCIFLMENLGSPTAQKSSARSIADGTVPLIAVVVTLGVILLVAASATCYRYWSHRRSRPRLPFWSIELREEKLNLSSECQYQHLDAATNKVVQATAAEDVEPENLHNPLPRYSTPKKFFRTMEV